MEKNDAIRFHLTSQPYGELSNFWELETPITHHGRTYPTAEHLYQSLKYTPRAADAASVEFAERIRVASTAREASLLGRGFAGSRDARQRTVSSVVRKYKQRGVEPRRDWFEMRLRCMQLVLWLKFSGDPHCREVLLGTGDRALVEHTKMDEFWGDGPRGNGANWLGQLLVRTRRRLRESPPDPYPWNAPFLETDPEVYARYVS